MRTIRCCALLALLAAVGCPKTEPVPIPPVTCSADSECGTDAGAPAARCLGGKCLSSVCGDHPCHAGQGCVDGECRAEDCLTVTCAAGEACGLGKCFPKKCGATACLPGDVCVADKCVFAGCAEKTCAREAVCADGRCLPKACGSATCAEGSACEADKCVAVACVGIACVDGAVCVAGRCVKASCEATACAAGQACVDAKCVDPTCYGMTCGAGQRCAKGACGACPAKETACDDGTDDDCDGKTDCSDTDCDRLDCAAGKTCQSGACALEPCGDGKPEAGKEDCDDGNRKNGDGCSITCKVECGFTCDNGKPSLCTGDDLVDLSAKVAAVFGATDALRAVVVGDDAVYAGGDKGKLVRLDRTCTATDLTPKIASFWGDAPIIALAWDSTGRALYLGGAVKGRFALYHPPGWSGSDPKHPEADTAWDLSGKHGLITQPWGVTGIAADGTGKAIYLAATDSIGCGPSHLIRYRPEADACDLGLNTCPNPCLAPPDACGVNVLAVDEPGRVLWSSGRGKIWTGLHKLDLKGGAFQKCASATLSNNKPTALVLDASGGALYVAGAVYDSPGGDFVRWEPVSGTVTKLTDKLAALFGGAAGDLNDMFALTIDPVNHVVYVGGRFAKFAAYRTPQNANSPDKASLVALSTTPWGQETVRGLAYDPAGFIWIAGEGGKLMRLKAKP